jgi:uncharacterized protein (DUF952 family)
VARIYKIVGRQEWAEAEREGQFRGAGVDIRDGYIHLSTREQVEETVARYFAGRDDLVAVALDADSFGEALKWEPSRGGALFPHLYEPLPLDRVVWAKPFSSREPGGLRALIART